jgi:pimeloyl-ACP methyl ester carboxylesterase
MSTIPCRSQANHVRSPVRLYPLLLLGCLLGIDRPALAVSGVGRVSCDRAGCDCESPPRGRGLPVCPSNAVPYVRTKWVQVAPSLAVGLPAGQVWVRRPEQARAVVLIHGLSLHPIHIGQISQPQLMDWQEPDSNLVRQLEPHADVYAFCYGQNAPVTAIADQPSLREGIARLKQLGYAEVVLIGYSAGGLVARQFVEDYPDAGVTRVVQVCTPNLGTKWARLPVVSHTPQEVFVKSMTPEARAAVLRQRADKRLPDGLEFVCVVAKQLLHGDGIVPVASQWPADLRQQGVAGSFVKATHVKAMYEPSSVEQIRQLAITPSPRPPLTPACQYQSPPMP